MQRGLTGQYVVTSVAGENVHSFVPQSLPPKPAVRIEGSLQVLMERAALALGRLDSLSTILPDTHLFLYMYVRKEAVLSSQIEGTQTSLSDLLLYELDEMPGVPLDDVVEVSNYVAALNHGLKRLRGGFPLCNRLIREIHAELLKSGRGSQRDPGEFRRSQNWLGGSRPGNAIYVPPPQHLVRECMSALERFLHESSEPVPLLVRAGLAHVQFETIHPFLDGNGRIGRLLITFLLCHDGALREPMLYLSLYLKQNRVDYYRLLNEVRTEGSWEEWLEFFFEGVRDTADQAVATAQRLVRLFEDDRLRIQELGRAAGSALRIHHVLTERPIVSLTEISRRTGLSFPAAAKAMNALSNIGVTREVTGRKRDRLFGYDNYLDVLKEGTELL